MKARKIALLAALPAAILMANSAYAGVDVYGKVNVSLQDLSEETNSVSTKDQWELLSNASRFGVKASTDLGDTGLKAIAKIEYQVDVDNGTNSNGRELSQRNIYGGLQGGFGTVIGGKFDTPAKEAQGKVDLFNDLVYGDIGETIEGEDRPNNIVMYSTPKMDSGISFNLAFMPGEGQDLDNNGKSDDGIADAYSASVTWENKIFYAAIAMNSAVDSRDLIRLVGQAKFGDLTVGAILQQAELSNDLNGTQKSDEDGYVISAAYKIDKFLLKAQYAAADEDDDIAAGDEEKRKAYSLGVDYSLDKKSKLFAYYTDWEEKEGANKIEKDTLAVGFEYSF